LRIWRIDAWPWIRKFESTPSFIDSPSSYASSTKRIARIESDIASVNPHTRLVGTPKHVELAANRIDRARYPIDHGSRIEN
jgi:hypothetical protein